MAISKLILFGKNWCSSRSIAISNVNKACVSIYNSFSTSIKFQKTYDDDDHDNNLIEVRQSPDIPIWVRIAENDSQATKTLDDDFVHPSLSSWIENRKSFKTSNVTVVDNKDENDIKKIGSVLVKIFDSVDSVVQALNQTKVIPTESLVAQMLKRFVDHWKSAYGVFVWGKSCIGSKFSRDTYDLMVDCLGKSKKFDLMRQVVEEMVQIGDGYVTLNTMAKVIRRLARARLYEDAIDEFRLIEQYGVTKDVSALNILVDALVKEKNVHRANDMFLEFKDIIPPNASTFCSLIHGWSKVRNYKMIQIITEQMKEHGFSYDVVTYTSLIEAYCSERDFKKVDQVLEKMKENGCEPNIITYTVIMRARGNAKEIDKALKVYEKMKLANCVPDTLFFNSLIFILSKSGRLRDARQVFDEMSDQGVDRNTQTYNTMITSACAHTQEEGALKLLYEMEKCGMKPDIDTYAPLLKMCLKLKSMRVVSFLLNHMLDNNVSIGPKIYKLLITGSCTNKKLEHACLFLEDAVMRGLVPYNSLFKLLETELEKAGMTKEMKRIQELKLKNMTFLT